MSASLQVCRHLGEQGAAGLGRRLQRLAHRAEAGACAERISLRTVAERAEEGHLLQSSPVSRLLPVSPLCVQIFLERLLSEAEKKGPMRVPLLEQIDGVLKLTSVKNCELRLRWNLLCLRAGGSALGSQSVDAARGPVAKISRIPVPVPLPFPSCTGAKFILENTVDFVTSQGRMKYVRPLYREMFKSPMARILAVETFLKHASSYHPIARKMVAADLHIKTGEAGGKVGGKEGASHAAGALKLDRSVLALLVIGTAALGVALFLARKKGVKRA